MESWNLVGIRNFEYLVSEDGLAAKGEIAPDFAYLDANFGLKPQAVRVHEGKKGDGSRADLRGELDDVVEFRLGLGIEDIVTTKCRETLFLVRRQ